MPGIPAAGVRPSFVTERLLTTHGIAVPEDWEERAYQMRRGRFPSGPPLRWLLAGAACGSRRPSCVHLLVAVYSSLQSSSGKYSEFLTAHAFS